MSEIDSADRIDLVMAFIRRSGTRPFIEALRRPLRRRSQATGTHYDLHRLY